MEQDKTIQRIVDQQARSTAAQLQLMSRIRLPELVQKILAFAVLGLVFGLMGLVISAL